MRLLVTLSVPTDEVLYGVFGARSREIVSRTCMQAGAPHQRLSDDIGTRIRQSHPSSVAVKLTAMQLMPRLTPYLLASARSTILHTVAARVFSVCY